MIGLSKKKAKNSKNSAADETEYESLPEDMTEPDSGEPQTTADTQKMKDDDREALLPGAFSADGRCGAHRTG